MGGSKSKGRQRKTYLDDLAMAAGNISKGELLHLVKTELSSKSWSPTSVNDTVLQKNNSNNYN